MATLARLRNCVLGAGLDASGSCLGAVKDSRARERN